MNWNQNGMPAALVSQLGLKREVFEFKSVLNDACGHIRQPVDVERMAQELAQSGGRGREFVEMVRALTEDLASAKKELEFANQRYERLVADLKRRGVGLEDPPTPEAAVACCEEPPKDVQHAEARTPEDGQAIWEEWDRRFRALLG